VGTLRQIGDALAAQLNEWVGAAPQHAHGNKPERRGRPCTSPR
jgi:hypothetical protein